MTDPDPPPDYQHPDEPGDDEDLSAAETRAADEWAMWAHGDDYDLEAW